MTFRLDLANRAHLFRNYASWYEDDNMTDRSHIRFTFSICYLINSLENIHKNKLECIQQYDIFKEKLKGQSDTTCFQSPSLFNLFSEISISLTQIRIIQNTLLELIGKNIKESFPASMNDYIKRSKDRKKCTLEEKVFLLIKNYWQENGIEVKQYRDLDQHYGQLFHNAVLLKNGNTPNIELRLPDNPEVKSWKSFTYDKKIDAILFIQKSFKQLHELINQVSKTLGYKGERVFDLTTIENEEFDDYLTVVFDPFEQKILGQEVFKSDGGLKCMMHMEECDLDAFSFIKTPEYFKCEKLPKLYFSDEKLKIY